MFARSFAVLSLALLASCSRHVSRSQCNTGPINCCNSVQTVSEAHDLLSQLDLIDAAVDAGGLVGLSCTAVAGSGCTSLQQPVCCSNDDFNGLVAIGCSPINANL